MQHLSTKNCVKTKQGVGVAGEMEATANLCVLYVTGRVEHFICNKYSYYDEYTLA